MGKPDQVKVRFFADGGQIKGHIIEDPSGRERRKLVLIDRDSKGPAPKPEQELVVEVVKDTQPAFSTRGVLFVRVTAPEQTAAGNAATSATPPHPWIRACAKLALDFTEIRDRIHTLRNGQGTFYRGDDLARDLDLLSDPQELKAWHEHKTIHDRAWRELRDECVIRANEHVREVIRRIYVLLHFLRVEVSFAEHALRATSEHHSSTQSLLDLVSKWSRPDWARARVLEKEVLRLQKLKDQSLFIDEAQAKQLQPFLDKAKEAELITELPFFENERPRYPAFVQYLAPKGDELAYWQREKQRIDAWIPQAKGFEIDLRKLVDDFCKVRGRPTLKEVAASEGEAARLRHADERRRFHHLSCKTYAQQCSCEHYDKNGDPLSTEEV